MKNRLKPIFVSLIVIGSAAIAQADTYNWNGSTTGGLLGTNNVWDTTTANWTGFGTTWPTTSTLNDDANFAGTAGVVTLDTTVTANDVTFSAGGYTVGVDDTAGILILDGSNPTITGVTGSLSSIGAKIQGSSGLTKAGSATIQLRGVNTYTGDTRVLRGNLLMGRSSNRLPIGTTLVLGDPVANTNGVFQMNSRSQQVGGLTTAGTSTANRVINSSATTTTFTVNNTADHIFGGILGGTGANDNNYNFTKSGIGKLTLTSTNTYTGTTTVSGGTLVLGHATDTIAETITSTVNINGGTLDIADKTETIGALTVTSGSITGTTGILSAPSCAGKAGTVSAILAGTTNLSGTNTTWLTKDTAGTLTLSAANTFTGNITVNAGRLTLSNSQALGVADPAPGGTNRKGIIMQGGDRSLWLKGGITIPSNIDFFVSSNSGDGGGINNESGDNLIQGPINYTSGNPALNISSAADSLTISGNITLTIDATTRNLILGGASAGDNTISGVIGQVASPSRSLPVLKQGVGKWILSGVNTYTGDTTVNGGTLVLASGGSTRLIPKSDASSNKITGNATGTLTLNGALNIDLTDAALAPDLTSWLLVDVDNVAETFDTSFTVTGFTETALDSKIWKKTVGASTYTFTESDGRLEKTAAVTSTPFQDWMSTNFPLVTPNTPEADSDNDGVSNLAEFAFSGNPGNGTDTGLKRSAIDNISGTDYLTYTFACRTGASFTLTSPALASQDGVDYAVRASTDLSTFTFGVDEVSPAITTGLPAVPTGYTYRTFRVTSPKTSQPKAFIQVKTSPTP